MKLLTTFFIIFLLPQLCTSEYSGNVANIDFPGKRSQRILAYIIIGVFFFLLVVGFLLCYYFQKIQAWFSGPQPIVPPVVDIESSIPMQLFSEVVQGPEEPPNIEMECAICITPFSAEDMVRAVPGCLHAFHTECIDGWLAAGNRSCPVCRQNMEV